MHSIFIYNYSENRIGTQMCGKKYWGVSLQIQNSKWLFFIHTHRVPAVNLVYLELYWLAANPPPEETSIYLIGSRAELLNMLSTTRKINTMPDIITGIGKLPAAIDLSNSKYIRGSTYNYLSSMPAAPRHVAGHL